MDIANVKPRAYWSAAWVPVRNFDQGGYLVMATVRGLVKKTSLEAYRRPRPSGG